MAPAKTDSDLVADSLGNPAAFAEIFERHYDAISLFLRRRVDESLADELAAQTFLQAFAARAGFDTSRSTAKPWLLGAAHNLIRHEARSRERRLRAYTRLDRQGEPDFSLDAIARVDAETSRGDLVEALAELTDDERDVLTLHAWEGLTYAEIAETLQTPIGTVRSRLARARAQMAARLPQPELRTTGVNADGN